MTLPIHNVYEHIQKIDCTRYIQNIKHYIKLVTMKIDVNKWEINRDMTKIKITYNSVNVWKV